MDYLQSEMERLTTDPNAAFVIKYKAGMRSGLSREQLASYMGITPQTLMRKRLKVEEATGVSLDVLEQTGEASLPADILDEFEETIELMELNWVPTRIEEFDTNKRYVITSAQNATPSNKEFLASLLNYCDRNDAELLIIPIRYRNPTSMWTERNESQEWWAPDLLPYIHDYSRRLGKSLEYLGHIPIQPTAVNPLTGFESYTGLNSAIFGHPKVALQCIATPSQNLPKILTTTGSITRLNFTDSKAGHKGAFHHSFAAVVAEIDGEGHHHLRHIHFNEEKGGFHDLDSFYDSKNQQTGIRAACLITGDSHAEFISDSVEQGTYFADGSLVNLTKPRCIVKHDVDDFYRRNHHHRGDDVTAYVKHHGGRDNVEQGLQVTADYLDRTTFPDTYTVVIRANHDEAFDRWLRECEPKRDPENSRFYYYMKFHQLTNAVETSSGGESFDAFPWWCLNPLDQPGLKNTDVVHFKKRDESFTIKDIELGFHGDRGTNGTKGSLTSFSKIGPKVVIGHSHTPGIKEGAYQVGLSAEKDLEYQSGPSSWMHTHCLIYADGSRTLIHLVDGNYRAEF